MKALKNFFDKHNLRPFESTWLLFVHIMGFIGLIYAFNEPALFSKILLTHCIFHNVWALGITAGAHRLWSHKSYQASFVWKVIVMILNSGKTLSKKRCKSRLNLPLEQRSQTPSQIFRH